MSYHRGVARDNLGNSLYEAQVTVYDPGTTTESSIYSEETLTDALDNPFTTGEDGVYEFYCDPGYYDISVAKSGFTTVTLSDQAIGAIVGHIRLTTGDGDTVSTSPVVCDDNYGSSTDWNLSYGGGFSIDSDGRLQYDGNPTVQALVNVGLRVADGTGGDALTMYLYKNGSPAGGGAQISDFDIPTASAGYVITFTTVLELVTGDNLTLALQRASGSATVSISLGWVTATGL